MSSTTPLQGKAGLTAAITGLTIVFNLVALRLLLWADETRVFFLGREFPLVCALRRQTGLPCPTCGFTRSFVLSLHGELARAWHVAPVGPVLVIGLAAFALALLLLAWFERCQKSEWEQRTKAWLRRGALAYAGFATLAWSCGWAFSFAAALRAR